MWSPAEHNASTTVDTAPMPDANACAASAPSRAATASSNAGEVVEVHRLREQQIRVRVEPARQLVALVLEVSLDLEPLPHLVLLDLFDDVTTEPVGEHVVGAERDLADHPRQGQAFARTFAR